MAYQTSPSRQSWHMWSVGVAGRFLQNEQVPPTSVVIKPRKRAPIARSVCHMQAFYPAPIHLSTKENNHA